MSQNNVISPTSSSSSKRNPFQIIFIIFSCCVFLVFLIGTAKTIYRSNQIQNLHPYHIDSPHDSNSFLNKILFAGNTNNNHHHDKDEIGIDQDRKKSSSNKNRKEQEPLFVGKPVSYSERHKTCMHIKRALSEQQIINAFKNVFYDMMSFPMEKNRDDRKIIKKIYGEATSDSTNDDFDHHQYQELIHLRVSTKEWHLDQWLSTCSLILESLYQIESDDKEIISLFFSSSSSPSSASSSSSSSAEIFKKIRQDNEISGRSTVIRHVFLFAINGHEDSVPPEFRPFVQIHDEPLITEVYGTDVYSNGYVRGGDLPSADFVVGRDKEFAQLRAKSVAEQDEKQRFILSKLLFHPSPKSESEEDRYEISKRKDKKNSNFLFLFDDKIKKSYYNPSKLYDFIWSLELDVSSNNHYIVQEEAIQQLEEI